MMSRYSIAVEDIEMYSCWRHDTDIVVEGVEIGVEGIEIVVEGIEIVVEGIEIVVEGIEIVAKMLVSVITTGSGWDCMVTVKVMKWPITIL